MPESATAVRPHAAPLLDGSTFVVCDQRGDVDGVVGGVRLLRRGHALSVALGADDRRRARRPGLASSRARRTSASSSWSGSAGLGGAARAVRRSRARGGGDGLEPVRPRGARWCSSSSSHPTSPTSSRSSAWRTSARRGTSEVAPSRPEHWKDAAHGRVRRRGLPGAHARASGSGARRARTEAPRATGCGSRPASAGSSASPCSGS